MHVRSALIALRRASILLARQECISEQRALAATQAEVVRSEAEKRRRLEVLERKLPPEMQRSSYH